MSCLLLKHHLIDFIEHKLPQEKQLKLQDHLANCRSCQELCHRFSGIYNSLDEYPLPEPSAYFYSKIVTKLEDQSANEYVLPVKFLRLLKPVAAGLFLVTGITVSLLFREVVNSGSLVASPNTTIDASTWANEFYLDSSEETMVDLILNNEN